ncbi:hypothetical protein AX14_001840 [Amanita brunnescens Koide BX004]|nr:hypothetical protein AX14_001840 [Amanita brunnescens Koide BX004]
MSLTPDIRLILGATKLASIATFLVNEDIGGGETSFSTERYSSSDSVWEDGDTIAIDIQGIVFKIGSVASDISCDTVAA